MTRSRKAPKGPAERRRRNRDKITRAAPALCPRCGYAMDATARAPGALEADPRPGDWTVCGRCTEPLVLDAELRPAAPPLGGHAALRLQDPGLWDAVERARRELALHNATAPGGGFGGSQQQGKA